MAHKIHVYYIHHAVLLWRVMFDALVVTGGHVQPAGDTERREGSDLQGGQDTLLGLGRRPAQ